MQKTRKERILEALQEEKKNKKSKKFKTGATIAGVTAIATSITVPGIEVIVSADETAPADEASKSAEANTTKEAPATATPENTAKQTVEPQQTETKEQTKTPEEKQAATNQVEKAPAEPATVSNPDNATSSSTPATYNLLQKSALRSGATVQSFIQTIQASSSQIAAENDLYASVMIAQAILESAYGTSELGSAPNYNLFGIKGAYNGQSYTKQTLEDDGKGNYYTITAKFRKYPSYHQSLEDYAQVIRKGPSWNPNYYSKVWKSNTTSYKDATKALTGTYATDTAYATKLNDLISRYNLTQYDSGKTTGGNSGSTGNSSNTGNTNTSNAKIYTVVKGDSLWRIANNHKVTVANLKAWNNLKSDFIYPGQKLKVSAGSTTSDTNTSKPSTGTSTSKPSTGTSTNAKIYTVVKGDSLWRIANNNKVTIANLKAWNNLKSDFIYPGQKLKVSAGSTSNTNTSKPSTNTNTSKPSTNTNTNAKVYTVAKGDSLWRIANNNKVTIANLKAWNNLKSDFIYPGQKLKVSAGSTTNTNTAKPSTNNPSNSTVKTYTVKKGDSLWAISRQYKTTVDNIKAWNKLTSNMIHVGQKLTIK
ncbi:TPA: 1,4-beta-N-acetylmuramoylhydrolase [Listeria monocytogenes]|uniref:1,4-beta-N-acetylmuramoylhydrolase n=1 Tax=Listeria monocytogenes TaxID=1639 RepID=UPI00077A69B1|nr:1,4-beta-N-acetylmuramoylhydrolase [Listeria monocytogenes]EAD3236013.1 1,4-beta-N-acetylmuramoylhydrolase [Listeria monocytogenes CFSAN002202]EAF4520750.1 1,4-beta-N-acetylmuramoylhydrolase [Listeria monocytogenes serotype 4b]EAF4536140.1 1,4-beta-N-acetylmuramoylhydrolase [Listeria monocytogenes serotype 1/2a]EAG9423733.1 1,4-beta-N-acetylmuramoylhydrolase [Listeria monocytogenes CFSAN002184]EAG9458660.1 1,4-beta-N-acetylmuramoylhydrolase [Listeria monocytogenes CFSAN002208]ECT1641171.1 